MAEEGAVAEGVVHGCRVRVELAGEEAAWGETLAGALVLEAGEADRAFDRVEVGLLWRTADLVLETTDGNAAWERFTVGAGERLRLLFFLKVPRGADLGGAAQVRVILRAAGMRSQRMAVPVSIRMPALYAVVAAELEAMTGLRTSAWLALPTGRGAEAWLRPRPEQQSPLASVYLRIVPYGRMMTAIIILQCASRPEWGFLARVVPGRQHRVEIALDEGKPGEVRVLLEARLRTCLSAAAGLPRPASPPPLEPETLPRPALPVDKSA